MEIAITSWQASEPDIRHIRESVFILELGIPAELEWDRHDQDSIHVLASAGEHGGIATGRLLPGGQLGRMAVLAEWRSQGVGTLLLHALMSAARDQDHSSICLNAQTNVCGFYKKSGFRSHGPPFMEAGIEHQHMICML